MLCLKCSVATFKLQMLAVYAFKVTNNTVLPKYGFSLALALDLG